MLLVLGALSGLLSGGFQGVLLGAIDLVALCGPAYRRIAIPEKSLIPMDFWSI